MRFVKLLGVAILFACGLVGLVRGRFLVAQPNNVAQKPAGPVINYTLPKDGEVTLGIYDQQGQLLRTVLSGEARSQGKNADSWDGLDQWGKPISAGSYLLKGIYHPPVATSYVMTFGNPGNPPWPTSDGKGDWVGDESSPQAAASDGKWIFLGSPGAEKGSTIIALDGSGQRQWGLTEPFNPATISLAVDGDYLYALLSGPQLTDSSGSYRPGGANAVGRAVLICLDKRTGRAARFTVKEPLKVIAKWPFTGETVGLWDLRTQKKFAPGTYNGQPRYSDMDLGETTNAIGLAVANQRIYVSMRDDNQLLVFDAETGAKVDQIPVPAPAGLFAEANHSILAISDQHVLRINPANKQIQTVVSAGLAAPRCVTEDQKNRIYVSDWGTSFQVKVFSPSGAPQRSIGEEGGRPWVGPWNHNGMLVPTGITVAGDGKLWVAEDDSSPSRISVWNPDTGAFVKEYLGPPPYGGPGAIVDPKDPTDANAIGTRFKLNFSAKTWIPRAVMERRMDMDQPFALNGAFPFNPGQKVLYHDGVEYQTTVTVDGIAVHKRKGDLLVPVAAMGSLRIPDNGDGTGRTIWDSDLGRRLVENFYPPFFRGHAGNNYTWTDTNGDGLVQTGEMQWFRALSGNDSYGPGTQPIARTYWGIGIGDDWSIYWSGAYKNQSIIFRMDLKGWTADGAPIYDIHDSKPIVVRDGAWEPIGLFATKDGKFLATYNYEMAKAANAIECFDRNGKSLWALAMPKPPPAGPGQGPKDILAENVIAEFQVPGLGSVLGSWLWHGNNHPYLFTEDGLYVASLLEETHLGPNAAWDESYKSYYQDPQGIPYIINGGSDAYHILKIEGLDQGGRFQEPFTVTQQDFAKAAAYRQTPASTQAPKPIINVSWAAQTPDIDGKLDDWNMKAGATLQGSKGRGAQVALTRDASNLYLAYQVTKDRPFSNKGENWQTLFLAGDCVDLMLSTDATGGRHTSPGPGDERLLISMYHGKSIAVLYRPVVPGTRQPIQLMAARLDDIQQLPSARIAIVPSGNSYTVEAAIPLKDIGIDPQAAGVTLQGDVGVIYADSAGNSRALRLYYYNKQTSMTADLTTEATLQPAQWGTIQFPLGKNLLKDSSFEDGFAAKSDLGWAKTYEKNAATANMTTDSPHSGSQSLMLQQAKPVVYPAAAVASPDYRTFLTSGNNGTGGSEIIVEQRVPVAGGHLYSFRFNYRADKLQPEKQTPGPGRGYSALLMEIEWDGSDIANAEKYHGTLDAKTDSPDWKQMTNSSSGYQLVPKPYRAPAGAASAVVRIRLVADAANDLPTAFVDDVELVDVTAGP
jgi:FlgD Ig-like domain